MRMWEKRATVAIGGVVAVAFVDDTRVAVGSHSGLGVFDVGTGSTVERVPDVNGDYSWYQADPPAVRYETSGGITLLPAAGLWGGGLPRNTEDGWTAELVSEGAVLRHRDQGRVLIADPEDVRALAFSPGESALVFASSSTLHIFVR
jgi:hypothetical protein